MAVFGKNFGLKVDVIKDDCFLEKIKLYFESFENGNVIVL